MSTNPLVSIVMPAYDAAEYICDSIASVLQQTYPHWELLVIDDASHDSTHEAVEECRNGDERIKIHKLPTNQGAGFARNIGIKASRGELICFLDADDIWKPEKLEKQIAFMSQEKVDVCYASYELMNENGESIRRKIKALPELSFQKLLKANYVGNLTGIYNAGKIGKIYCPLIRKRQDWGLWLLAVKKAGGAKGIQEPLAKYRIRKNSISRNKFEMLQYNYSVYREVLEFSTPKSLFWMSMFLWEQIFVKSRRNVRLAK